MPKRRARTRRTCGRSSATRTPPSTRPRPTRSAPGCRNSPNCARRISACCSRRPAVDRRDGRRPAMKCPKCTEAMEKVVHEGVEIDRCAGCGGLWFDMLEHEDLKAISGSEAIDTGSAEIGRANDGHTKIRCPVCDQPLIPMVVAAQPHIAYEACTVCYGVYFDAGEFRDFREETFAEAWNSLFGSRPR